MLGGIGPKSPKPGSLTERTRVRFGLHRTPCHEEQIEALESQFRLRMWETDFEKERRATLSESRSAVVRDIKIGTRRKTSNEIPGVG